MCYSSERFRRVASIIYFIYDSINCPTTVSEGVGGAAYKQKFQYARYLRFVYMYCIKFRALGLLQ